MISKFDEIIERKSTNCVKWDEQGGDFIPMWIADMDFKSPQVIIDALEKRIQHGVFGYTHITNDVIDAIVTHYKNLYDCTINPEWIVWIPSIMPGANLACRVYGGDIMYNIPMYSHIRKLPIEVHTGVIEVMMDQVNGHYVLNMENMENAITSDVKIFILCNPHNPIGHVYTPEELTEIVEFCKRHNLLLVCDEIHCELIFEGKHTTLVSLSEDARNNCIVLASAGKIANIPGLPNGFALIPNKELRDKYKDISRGLFSSPNVLSLEAMKLSFDGSCDEWKHELLVYLKSNRDYLEKRIANINGISVIHNEATYLAWLDCRKLDIKDPHTFFCEQAGVNLNGCNEYGIKEGFCRINFACPRSQLTEALDRIENVIKKI